MVTVAEIAVSDSAGNIAIACSNTATAIMIASSRYLIPFVHSFFEPKVFLDPLCPLFRLLDDSSQNLNELDIIFGYNKRSQSNVVPMGNGLEGPSAQLIAVAIGRISITNIEPKLEYKLGLNI